MSLQFIFGRSGTGKSEYLRNEVIKESLNNPDYNYVVMVPEQFNLQTQTVFCLNHPNQGLINIDVQSFTRMAYRVFEETGGFFEKVIDETGKLMILKKILCQLKGKLGILASSINSMERIKDIKSILSEFEQYNINENSIGNYIRANATPGLDNKIREILTIQEAFNSFIEEKYITKESIMNILVNKIPESKTVRKTVFVFDGYTGFTYLQNKVIRELLKYSYKVIIALTMDIRFVNTTVVSKHELFAMSVNTKTELIRIANEERIKILPPVLLEKNNRIEELDVLEKFLFSYKKTIYPKETNVINICECYSARQEIEMLRSEISKLTTEYAYSYSDIAIVSGDVNMYSSLFERTFSQASIPYFIDRNRNLDLNPAIEMIKSAIRIVISDFSIASVFSFLKTYMTDIEKYAIDKIENYCIAKDIAHYNRWSKEFKSLINGQSIEELNDINKTRIQFLDIIEQFYIDMSGKENSFTSKCKFLYEFFIKIELENKIKLMEEMFSNKGDDLRRSEYSQVYPIIIKVMDEAVEMLSDDLTTNEEFLNILETGFNASSIGILPPGDDYILFGDIERTRFSSIKILFLIGVNENIIPRGSDKEGLLNDSERMKLSDTGVKLAPSTHDEYYTQKYYLYRILTMAQEKLFLSYSRFSEEGDEKQYSYIIKDITHLFPKANYYKYDLDPMKAIYSYSDAYEYLINHHDSKISSRLYLEILESQDYRYKLYMFDKAGRDTGIDSNLPVSVAEKLYINENNSISTSISSLEKYAACPFAYFLSFGLNLKERVTKGLNNIDYGNILHQALKSYVDTIRDNNLDLADLDEDIQNSIAEKCIDSAYKNVYLKTNELNTRELYIKNRILRLFKRTVWAMKKQFSNQSFQIKYAEKSFTHEKEQPVNVNGKAYNIELKGIIDRIDTADDGFVEFVRVVDYKSGVKEFKLSDFYYGTQLQLIVYLDEAMRIEERLNKNRLVKPAGGFYYQIKDPIIKAEYNADETIIESEIIKDLSLNGYQNNEAEEIAKISLMPADIDLIIKYADIKLKSIVSKILEGHINVSPIINNNDITDNACRFCNYHGICRIEKSKMTETGRVQYQLDNEVFLEYMRKEESNSGSDN